MAKKKLTLEDMLVPRDEIPYEVPENWCWVKYESVIENVSSSNKKIKQKDYLKEGMFPVIDQGSDLIGGYTDDENLLYDGELPVIIFGDHTRCFKYIDFKFAQGADGVKVLKVKPGIYTKYMYYLMLNLELPNKGYSRHYKFLREAKLPIPPLVEQERIVNRIESLFDKIDRAADLVDEARDGFEKRRAAILSNAVRGNLTKEYRGSLKQNTTPDDILKLVLNKKEELIKSKKIKKDKKISDIEEKEILFKVPNSWKWVRLKDITINRDGERVAVSQSARSNREKIYDYYGASGVIDKIDNYIFDKELLLIGEDGANLVTRSKPIAFIAQGKYWVNNHAHVLDSVDLNILKYIEIYINSMDLGSYISGSAQPKLTQAKLNTIPIPLPSFEEQKEIVKIVNRLLEQENEIEDIVNIDLQIINIKKSILAKAFRGELGSNDLNEESSMELLKQLIK